MTLLDDSVSAPALPGPVPRRGRLPLLAFFRVLRDNMIATYPEEAYESEIVDRKIFFRHRFLVSEPAAIKHVLLDNAANYQKTEVTRRILEPGLGKGLVTSEGDTWRHRLLWKNPETFIPERFSAEQSAARPRFSYLPFGGGRRICIGAAFAMAEATVLLATIAQHYRLRLAPGHPVEPVGLVTLRARHGMQMLPVPRKP